MARNLSKGLAVLVIGGLVAAYYFLGLRQYFSLDFLKAQQAAYQAYYADHHASTLAIFFVVYVATAALSLPGATVLTLAAGGLFGVATGFPVVAVAATIGATLAFLAARFVLRDAAQARFGDRLQAVNAGIAKEGAFYLLTLRIMPIFPFFVVNLVMGLTPIGTWTFFWVSLVGMLPGTLAYVNAGTQLAQIQSLAGILSPRILVSFAALGLLPLVAKKILDYYRARRALRAWPKPRRFDYNVIVLGAGSGGLVAAYIAATVKAKVVLIEKNQMGGDCLNTGCVPSKALIRSANVVALLRQAAKYGAHAGAIEVDFAAVMARVRGAIAQIAPHDSVERYTKLGVECLHGTGRLLSPYSVDVGGRVLTARNIIVATGGAPIVPAIPGLSEVRHYTSETIWDLRERPRRLLVVGGGPIGCELAQAFQRLGSQVTVVEMAATILAREDAEVAGLVASSLQRDGIAVRTGAKVTQFSRHPADGGAAVATIVGADGTATLECDAVLLALGRRARTQGFGLEELGIRLDPAGTIEHDDLLRTSLPNIYCVGDVAGPYQLTHVASHQAWYAAVNALFAPFKTFRADYRVIPRVTFTDPEVAVVGLNEREAKARGIAYELTTYGIDDLDRAIAEGEDHGFVKVLTVPGKDKILGATVVGAHAGETFIEFVTAMKHGLGLNKILGTIHAYPTFAEANKYAAGNWKRAHAPTRLLGYVEKFHAWRRGAG